MLVKGLRFYFNRSKLLVNVSVAASLNYDFSSLREHL